MVGHISLVGQIRTVVPPFKLLKYALRRAAAPAASIMMSAQGSNVYA